MTEEKYSLAELSESDFEAQRDRIYRNTDSLFWPLLLLQWLAAIAVALWISPRTWAGLQSSIHPHVWAAVILGGIITAFPVAMTQYAPGQTLTRHSVAVGQMLMGSLLIHLTGGRIETHFHIFGSLAFLAFYRDWKVLVTASAVVMADHFLRGIFWPQSIFGVSSAPFWRAVEHTGWVIFEDTFLYFSIRQSLAQMRQQAQAQAALQLTKQEIESKVERRTRQLAQSEERFRSLSESAPVGILLTDPQGRYVYVNERWKELTGMSAKNPVLENISIMFHEDDRARITAIWRNGLARRERFEYPGRLIAEDGAVRWVYVRVNVLSASSGEFQGFVGSVEDTTEREVAAEQLAQARDAALESVRLKSEFLANMSHEIRTPMNAVMGMTSMLLETDLDDRQKEYAHTAYNSAESLLTILNDILDFSKIEAGKLSFESEDFDLRDVIEETLDLVVDQAHSKNLELIGFLEPGTPCHVRGDMGRLRQVLINLAGNAVKFTKEGEVALRTFQVEDFGEEILFRFEIRDTGIGIEKAVQDRLFEAFTQADGSTTRKYGGTGLGLAICKRIVTLMHGTLGIVSAPNQGALFWFTARLQKGRHQAEEIRSISQEKMRGARVLVVDDNLTNAMVLHHQLAVLEVEDHHAPSAEEALALLHADAFAGKPFDLVISDMQMPGTDGLSLAMAISGDRQLSGVPIIMLTSLGSRLDAATMKIAGIFECLLKPVKTRRLLATIAKAMGMERTPALSLTKHRIAEKPHAPRLRILVAEDNIANQKVIVLLLKRLGLQPDVAADGSEVLAALERSEYQLIFMDCQMPEMDGFEATARIRALPGNASSVHIVALTANAMQGDREKCLAAGMDDYLSKPVRLEDLRSAIRRSGHEFEDAARV